MAGRLVVIGGDAAGMSAASQARRRRGPEDLAITAFERGRFTSYSACGIPYLVGGAVKAAGELIARAPETFRSGFSIQVHLRHEAVEIDLDRRAVRVRDLEAGAERWEGFDQLVVATGAVPVTPDLPGADAAGVFGVQTLEDGTALLRALQERQPRRAVVVGGGYVGLEMAEALVMRGLEVALVEASPQPMDTLDPATFPGVVGTAASKLCGVEVARTGLGEAEAAAAGFEAFSVVVGSTTRAGYYPGAEPVTVKLVAERRSGRLLGGQVVGGEGAAKRIDALAVAVWQGMTAHEVSGLDLAYAPPFSPVWDPVLIAARKAAERVEAGTAGS